MPRDACIICNHEDRAGIEALGIEAMQGSRSWLGAAKEAGFKHPNGLRNHMNNHFVASIVERAKKEKGDELSGFLQQALDELVMAMATAPTETKPLYAVMIHNLSALEKTAPSAGSLIQAAKAIHEITGMKMQHRLLLGAAEAFQELRAAQEPKELAPAWVESEVIDVEGSEDVD